MNHTHDRDHLSSWNGSYLKQLPLFLSFYSSKPEDATIDQREESRVNEMLNEAWGPTL